MKQNLYKLSVMRAPSCKTESLSLSLSYSRTLTSYSRTSNEEQYLPAAPVLEERAQVFSPLRTLGPAHNLVVVVVVVPFVPRSQLQFITLSRGALSWLFFLCLFLFLFRNEVDLCNLASVSVLLGTICIYDRPFQRWTVLFYCCYVVDVWNRLLDKWSMKITDFI